MFNRALARAQNSTVTTSPFAYQNLPPNEVAVLEGFANKQGEALKMKPSETGMVWGILHKSLWKASRMGFMPQFFDLHAMQFLNTQYYDVEKNLRSSTVQHVYSIDNRTDGEGGSLIMNVECKPRPAELEVMGEFKRFPLTDHIVRIISIYTVAFTGMPLIWTEEPDEEHFKDMIPDLVRLQHRVQESWDMMVKKTWERATVEELERSVVYGLWTKMPSNYAKQFLLMTSKNFLTTIEFFIVENMSKTTSKILRQSTMHRSFNNMVGQYGDQFAYDQRKEVMGRFASNYQDSENQ